MGCGSSREAHPEPTNPPTSRAARPSGQNNSSAIDSRTAINHPLTSTSSSSRLQQNTRASRAQRSASDLSAQEDVALNEHYNIPLTAPKLWTSTSRTWTATQLSRERTEFFETRVAGRQEIWGALKEVTQLIRQGNLPDAQGILDAAGITLPTGKLEEGAYDERGVLYRLPEQIVSDPKNMVGGDELPDGVLSKKLEAGETGVPASGTDIQDKGKDIADETAMKVRCRLSDRGGPDTVVLLAPTHSVNVLLRRLRTEATIASSARVRIAYFGRILDESQTLEEQGWQQGHVVQALVSNFAP